MSPAAAKKVPAKPEEPETWRHHFRGNIEPIEKVTPPRLLKEYPNHVGPIFMAYMLETTFTIRVYINYDTDSARFYYDDRIGHCGKPHLGVNPKKLRFVQGVFFYKFRFLVGTPTQTLYEVDFQVQEDDPRILSEPSDIDCTGRLNNGYWLRAMGRPHRIGVQHMALYDFMAGVITTFNQGIPIPLIGVRLNGLHVFAASFFNPPDEETFSWIGTQSFGRKYRYLADWRKYHDVDEALEVLEAPFPRRRDEYDRRWDRRFSHLTEVEACTADDEI